MIAFGFKSVRIERERDKETIDADTIDTDTTDADITVAEITDTRTQTDIWGGHKKWNRR